MSKDGQVKRKALGISLSGGSVKGAYQAGALLYLEERLVVKHTDLVIGSSVGAINGVGICYGSASELVGIYEKLSKRSDLFKPAWWKLWDLKGLYNLGPTRALVDTIVSLRQPKKELLSCTVSLDTGEIRYETNLGKDPDEVVNWVMASATIPALMEPEFGMWFDGGVKETAPVRAAADRCEKVIAIVVSPVNDLIGGAYKPFWPPIASLAWRTIDQVMQHEMFLNDLKRCESWDNHDGPETEITVIAPDERIDVGTFEVSRE